MTSKDIFNSKVVPVMDSVRDKLCEARADELRKNAFSLSGLFANAAGPDGGPSASAAQADSLSYTGKWSSKTVEDYVSMVKAELKKQHVTVTPELEKMMINRMISEKIPRSSIDYVIRKAGTSSLFYLPVQSKTTPMQEHISSEAERRYDPSSLEKGLGWGLGATADYLSTAGAGGTLKGAATFIGTDIAVNAALSSTFSNAPSSRPAQTKAEKDKFGRDAKYKDVPSVIMPGQEENYLADLERNKSQAPIMPSAAGESMSQEDATTQQQQDKGTSNDEHPTNEDGWSNLLSSLGLNDISAIGNNLGYVLAMLPDMLVGLFTGKTKSVGLDRSTMMPLASIAAGMFIRNPLLKMALIGGGGLNLLNKVGHEALRSGSDSLGVETTTSKNRYKQYDDEQLNPRIGNPQLKGNCLIATIDNVPCTIALPDNVVDAYSQGALPLNTLANAVLAKNDRMNNVAQQQYEDKQAETVTRSRGIV